MKIVYYDTNGKELSKLETNNYPFPFHLGNMGEGELCIVENKIYEIVNMLIKHTKIVNEEIITDHIKVILRKKG